ncbi:VIT1/CCC1 transporter family protein [Candidatus Peregrinibacteria bacterium]|nr:VIT1/CCC1 transporter family protein [Candidatus Peregrinibacteria bacterium]
MDTNAELLSPAIKKKIETFQQAEITEQFVYKTLASATPDPDDHSILEDIAREEQTHYDFWKQYTNKDFKPNPWKARQYLMLAKLFGLSFALKLMESGEGIAQKEYKEIIPIIPEADSILQDEIKHEAELLALINVASLKYISSIVLGLNDALVELTGALAGLTLALADTHLIALTGLITGIAASLSMGASEYLSLRAEKSTNALRASLYTGMTYFITVLILVAPYFILSDFYFALLFTVINALLIILAFTFYTSVIENASFRRRFLEMAILSFSVMTITFLIGFLVNKFWGVRI